MNHISLILASSLSNDIQVQIDKSGILIGPIMNRNTRSIDYYRPIYSIETTLLKLKKYGDVTLSEYNDDNIISSYLSIKKSPEIIMDYITLCKDFDVIELKKDTKSRHMTDSEIIDDLDFITDKVTSMRKTIDDETTDPSIKKMIENLLHNEPHKIFNMESSNEYFKYLDHIDKLLADDEEEKMKEVGESIQKIDWE